jgi:hypothetical protein
MRIPNASNNKDVGKTAEKMQTEEGGLLGATFLGLGLRLRL